MTNTQNDISQPASQPASQPRRSAWQEARENAIEAARRNALHECPYRDARWQSFWFREFEKAQQLILF